MSDKKYYIGKDALTHLWAKIKAKIPSKTSELTNDSNFVDSNNLATVATSGSYTDLTNTPTIPTVNNATLTIQKNGTNVQTFTANSSTNATANITVPTKVSELTNDSNFVKNTDYATDSTGGVVKVGDGLSITDGVLSTSGGSITALDIYPVGSIYMSINSTDPSTLFGGTWEQIKDTFLLSCGDTYEVGATGGEATHTLTIAEMPSHTHTQNQHRHQVYELGNYGSTGVNRIHSGIVGMSQCPVQYSAYTTATNQNTGGNGAHNNMPPYLAVYMWKRTA